MYKCNYCETVFTRESSMRRHMIESCKNKGAPPAKRARSQEQPSTSTMVHMPSTSANLTVMCNCCNKSILIKDQASHRRTLEHRTNSCVDLVPGVQLLQSAFKCRIASYRISNEAGVTDYGMFFASVKNKIIQLLEEALRVHNTVKVNMELFARYVIQTQDIADIKCFNTANKVIDCSTNLSDTIDNFADLMISQTSEFQERDSGWALESILYVEVNVNKFSSLGGSSYIKLPKQIEVKKAVINVHNQDQFCFMWAIVSALYPAAHRSSDISSYPHFSTVFNVEGMNFPVKLRDIPKFEIRNNISINVYGLQKKFEDDKVVYYVEGPLYYSQKKLGLHLNLLLITNEFGDFHYCWIKDLSKLVSSQLSSNGHKKFFCDGCLLYFGNYKLLLQHQQKDCNHIWTVTPSTEIRKNKRGEYLPGNILKFENYEKQLEVPFIVYADFESVLKPIDTCEPNPQNSYTNKTFSHAPYSFAYIIKCTFDDTLSKFDLYRGNNAAAEFVKRLESDLYDIYNKYLKHVVPMTPLSEEEEIQFANASVCGICDEPFEEGQVKVKDHCHLTGKIRFAAHSSCNLHYTVPTFVPIIFHNMSGYDCHLFIKELFSDKSNVDVIAQNKEKYISFTKYLHVDSYVDTRGKLKKKYLKLRFIDSFKFMASSLQTLGENLDSDLFYETRKHFNDESKFSLMRQKGIFPYSFVNHMSKLDYPSLPSKVDFYDKLNEKHVSDDDYKRAQEVWNLFGCSSLGEYSDIYLKSDVLLLCDVFENFRKICLQTYKLDPTHYFTAPGLAWDAMLKLTKIELELLTDIDMIHMLKKGIRGGISQCAERKHIANNRFLPNYNSEEPISFIAYLDATNLYGHSMSQTLPINGFVWLSENEIKDFDVMKVAPNDSYGFILEVDVKYPQELHDKHSDLPFLVENIVPPNSRSKLSKLIPNLNDKNNYIVHYINLQQAIENGLILEKIHRVLKFNQSPWLKKYIDLNTEMRNNARNKFEKDFYKLMNNSVFGKTMENVDNRRDIKLLTHWEKHGKKLGASSLIARPNFKACSIFSENFVAIHLDMLKVTYNKPIYIGFSILELSKTVLYDFFYNVIKKHYGEKASLLYTDTDSLILKVYTNNFYNFMTENLDKFDTSNYKPDNKFNIPVSNSVLGRMKDEFPEDPIICFYGTGAKAYCVQSLQNVIKKAKGIKKCVIKNELDIDDYKKIVEAGGLLFRKMNTFRTYLHDMFTEVKNKVALSCYDDKRFVIPNTCKTLAWGHSDITFYQTDPEQNFQWLMNCFDELDSTQNALNTSPTDFVDHNLDELLVAVEEIENDN